MTAKELNLSPDQHNEQIFKQILGGCSGIVNGLGTLRNKLGDAHGKGKLPVKPQARHAELAVNLAGSMTLFLISTHANTKA
ncbi:abortive infection family protein [Idiomarina xiamenensis]|uniref:abortive infection family protein n=1 Tax=Idiomarina xiamenensis TaxID=1207041 RepID=UPI003B42FB70